MGFVCCYLFTLLPHVKQVSHAFFQNRREKRSTAVTPYHFDLFAMAGCAPHFPFLHCHIFGLQKQDCMNFSVQVKVMPLKELLDPQGKAVMGGLRNLGIKTVQDVRIGKTIQLQVEAGTAEEAKKIAEEASKKLLANPVMEYFEISVL